MPNRLTKENSPYLLQHKDNPVDWFPWGEEALNKAKKENKPIFLSIGYAACHWCHVMEHESFEDPATAEIMNQHFVNIKVDREERPDLDGIYMNAVVAMTGQGGWPMSVFLTPDGKPFYGGTYFPPVGRYNMPAFQELLLSIAKTWEEEQEKVLESSDKITEHIQQIALPPIEKTPLREDTLNQASMRLAQTYDWKNGGWGRAPKFPQPMAIRYLLRRASRGDKMALDIAAHALRAMAKGGMYDVVGGGFARYSVDDFWLVPHFEKMLYDNAQLARVYLHAFMLTKDDFFRQICEETLDFIVREMTHKEGGFYSSLDADSEGVEGKYYVWSLDEIEKALEDKEDSLLFIAAYSLSPLGNFEGKTVLQRDLSDAELAEIFNLATEEVPSRLKALHQKLYAVRETRIRPGTDDKVLTSWNAWMLTAFAEAARYLKRGDYLLTAQKNASFLLTALHPDDRLLRSWREGTAMHNAYLEDYASLVLGLLSLYQSDPDPRWFKEATRLTEDMLAHYRDENGIFYDTRDDHETLVTRPKDMQDNATPSGNSLAANAMPQMATYSGSGEWYDISAKMISGMQEYLEQHPTVFANWLCALDFALGEVQEVAIVGDLKAEGTQALVDVLWGELRPYTLAAIALVPPPDGSPALLADRPLVDGKPSAYVCRQFVCKQPVTDPEALSALLV